MTTDIEKGNIAIWPKSCYKGVAGGSLSTASYGEGMSVTNIVWRNYPGASIFYNIDTRQSVFIEGPSAGIASEFLDDPNYQVPDSFFAQFQPEDRNDILADCAEIRHGLLALSGEIKGTADGESLSGGLSPLKDLSGYATRNWQLVNVNMELTYQCNQRCRWCYLDNFDQKGMSRTQIAEVAEQLKEAGALFILLTGGEVFLRPDALDIMEDLEARGFIIEAKTNGTTLRPDMIERMADLHLFDVQVSVYETKDGFSHGTRSNYQFSRVAENVRLMLQHRIPVTISVLVGKHNINRIERIHETLLHTGAEIFYSPYITPNRAGMGEEISYRLTRREMEEKFLPFLDKIDALPTLKQYRDCCDRI